MIERISRSPADTLALGRKLAGLLHPGDVVLLSGKLGTGKTLFVSGVAEGLGVAEPVTSPSFVIMREYEGFLRLFHADIYRVGSTGELEDLELLETARDGALFIEWGDVVAGSLPSDRLVVEFERRPDDTRTIRFVPQGEWRQRPVEEMAA